MLRTFLALLLIAAIALAAWIVVPMLGTPSAVDLDQAPSLLALASRAPAGASDLVLVPSFGPTWRHLHPAIEPWLESRGDDAPLGLAAWALGPSNVAFWRAGDQWGLATDPSPPRRILVRMAAGLTGGLALREEEGLLLLGASSGSPGGAAGLALARGLRGHAFILQAPDSSSDFPFVGRPALTGAVIDGDGWTLVSHAQSEPDAPTVSIAAGPMPANALASARFAEPPPALRSLLEALPVDLRSLITEGGLVALYGIDSKGLLPKPRLAFSVPARSGERIVEEIERATTRGALGLLLGMREERRTVLGVDVVRKSGASVTIDYARRGDQLLLAFDPESLESLLGEQWEEAEPGAVIWMFRARPAELLPLLDDLRKNGAIRLLARDLSRGAGDLAEVLRLFPHARAVTGRLERGGGSERMVTRVALSK